MTTPDGTDPEKKPLGDRLKDFGETLKKWFERGKTFGLIVGVTTSFIVGLVGSGDAEEKAEKGMVATVVAHKETRSKIRAIEDDLDYLDEEVEECADMAERLQELEAVVAHMKDYYDKRTLVARIDALEKKTKLKPAPVRLPNFKSFNPDPPPTNKPAKVKRKKRRKEFSFSEDEILLGDIQQQQRQRVLDQAKQQYDQYQQQIQQQRTP